MAIFLFAVTFLTQNSKFSLLDFYSTMKFLMLAAKIYVFGAKSGFHNTKF